MLTIRKRFGQAPEPTHDRRGYPRSPITLPSYRQGRPAANKGRRYPAEPLTAEEVYRLIAACKGPAAKRNRAMITMFWRTGLRNAELLALYSKDVDLKHGRVQVLHGKGDKRRVVAIDYAACRIVELWEEERHELGFGQADAYFCVIVGPTRGLPLQNSYPRCLLKDLAKKAGVAKRVHPHGLRHSYAAHLLEENTPIHYIRRTLGHTSIAITERYADHVNPALVIEALREVKWPDLF